MAGPDNAEPQFLAHVLDLADGGRLHVLVLRRGELSRWICLMPSRLLERRGLGAAPLHVVARRAALPDSVLDYAVRPSMPPTDVEMGAASSGVHAERAIRKEHKTLFTALQLVQSCDPIDVPATAGSELSGRRVIRIQRAVFSNPKAPNFVGLEKTTTHAVDRRGGLAMMVLTPHFATVAEADVRILNPNRLVCAELQSGLKPGLEDGDEGGLDETAPAPKARPRRLATPKAKA